MTRTDDSLQALLQRHREIAEKATPGYWKAVTDDWNSPMWWVVSGHKSVGEREHDAAHIATFDPTTVAALLDVAEAALRTVNEIEEADDGDFVTEQVFSLEALTASITHLHEVMKGEVE